MAPIKCLLTVVGWGRTRYSSLFKELLYGHLPLRAHFDCFPHCLVFHALLNALFDNASKYVTRNASQCNPELMQLPGESINRSIACRAPQRIPYWFHRPKLITFFTHINSCTGEPKLPHQWITEGDPSSDSLVSIKVLHCFLLWFLACLLKKFRTVFFLSSLVPSSFAVARTLFLKE